MPIHMHIFQPVHLLSTSRLRLQLPRRGTGLPPARRVLLGQQDVLYGHRVRHEGHEYDCSLSYIYIINK